MESLDKFTNLVEELRLLCSEKIFPPAHLKKSTVISDYIKKILRDDAVFGKKAQKTENSPYFEVNEHVEKGHLIRWPIRTTIKTRKPHQNSQAEQR